MGDKGLLCAVIFTSSIQVHKVLFHTLVVFLKKCAYVKNDISVRKLNKQMQINQPKGIK